MANKKPIDRVQIDEILYEAEDYTELPDIALKASRPAESVSISGFKTAWPTKIRPALLFAISVLNMFRQTKFAEYVAQTIAVVDLFVGGQISA